MDTGASINLISKKDLTDEERKTMRALTTPVRMKTAKGIVRAYFVVDIFIDQLSVLTEVYVLPNTEPVLSTDLICETGPGFRFTMGPKFLNENPTVQNVESGKQVRCVLDQGTPMLPPHKASTIESAYTGKVVTPPIRVNRIQLRFKQLKLRQQRLKIELLC